MSTKLVAQHNDNEVINITKSWLGELLELQQACISLKELYDNTDGMKAVQYSIGAGSSSNISDITALVGMNRSEIAKRLKNTRIRVKIIENALQKLNEIEYQAVYNRYVLKLSWAKVADKLYFSERWSKKIAKRGLISMSRSLFGIGVH